MAAQCLGILFTYSRGAIMSMFAGLIFTIPLSIWKSKDRITTSISIALLLGLIGLVVLYFYKL